REGIVFEEIEVDEGEGALEGNENERTVLEENEVIVLEDSEEENEEISELKRSEAVWKLVEEEAAKDYPPTAITNVVKEYATRILDLGSSVKELRRAEVTNIKYKVCEMQNNNLGGNLNKETDIKESILFLKNQGYHVEHYVTPCRTTYGLVFIHPFQLVKLEKHGWLTLIDSTHKTN
ncbi:44600_t:CDS:2, partial [Gigaspora margarita]